MNKLNKLVITDTVTLYLVKLTKAKTKSCSAKLKSSMQDNIALHSLPKDYRLPHKPKVRTGSSL